MDERLDAMQGDIGTLTTDMSETKERLDAMKTDIVKIQLTQENKILPRMQLLFEGDETIVTKLKRLEHLPEQVEDIQGKVAVLDFVFKEHTQG